eukprot:3087572-Prymnesium_polylepis.1
MCGCRRHRARCAPPTRPCARPRDHGHGHATMCTATRPCARARPAQHQYKHTRDRTRAVAAIARIAAVAAIARIAAVAAIRRSLTWSLHAPPRPLGAQNKVPGAGGKTPPANLCQAANDAAIAYAQAAVTNATLARFTAVGQPVATVADE